MNKSPRDLLAGYLAQKAAHPKNPHKKIKRKPQ